MVYGERSFQPTEPISPKDEGRPVKPDVQRPVWPPVRKMDDPRERLHQIQMEQIRKDLGVSTQPEVKGDAKLSFSQDDLAAVKVAKNLGVKEPEFAERANLPLPQVIEMYKRV